MLLVVMPPGMAARMKGVLELHAMRMQPPPCMCSGMREHARDRVIDDAWMQCMAGWLAGWLAAL